MRTSKARTRECVTEGAGPLWMDLLGGPEERERVLGKVVMQSPKRGEFRSKPTYGWGARKTPKREELRTSVPNGRGFEGGTNGEGRSIVKGRGYGIRPKRVGRRTPRLGGGEEDIRVLDPAS